MIITSLKRLLGLGLGGIVNGDGVGMRNKDGKWEWKGGKSQEKTV